jgi:hypothetical protein
VKPGEFLSDYDVPMDFVKAFHGAILECGRQEAGS